MEPTQEPDEGTRTEPVPPARAAAALYAASALAIAVALVSEFFVAYQLLLNHPAHAPELLKETYAALALGLLLIAAQAGLVYAALVRPVRENALEIARLKASLDQHCHHDELTKVLNRMAFEHMLPRELENLKRYGAGFCGIMADADGFGGVNEALGYEAGDLVLYELAQLLKGHVRKADYIFRWRSGRFMILAAGIGAEQGLHFAAKLRDLVAQHDFRQGVRLSISLGVAQASPEDSPETFAARVKSALALAKDKGRGEVAAA